MINSTFKPANVGQFEIGKLLYNAQGVSATVPAGTTQNLDLVFTDDHLITGVAAVVNAGAYGDTVAIQVYDASGAFSGTPGTVLNQFVTNWYVPAVFDGSFDLAYSAKILAGMGLRTVYASTGGANVFVAMNYKVHKVMV